MRPTLLNNSNTPCADGDSNRMVELVVEEGAECEVQVGARVQVGEDRGTVLYVGRVPPTHGLWLGVDWDDPARGRHNGTYNGTTYFTARYETSGSLVRVEKVCTGQDVVAALEERYGATELELDEQTVHDLERSLNAPFLKMVGFDKVASQQRYECLRVVGLMEHRVHGAGEAPVLASKCPLVEELDLSRNLLPSWTSVAGISRQLPHLTFLDLSENRLTYDDDTEKLKSAFSKLEYLVLSRVEYCWEDILHCARMWPHIQKLQVSYNRITDLCAPPPSVLQNLTLLNLEGNLIVDWAKVAELGVLKKLEILSLSHCGLTEVRFPSPNPLFPSLRYILLSGNFISSWDSVNELNKLHALNELKLRENPILNGLMRVTARQIIIASVASLKIVNGQEVSEDERRGAEYDYLKQHAKVWHESKGDPIKREDFIHHYPRYPLLVHKYGEIDEIEFEVKSTALKSRLALVELCCEGRTVKKRLPPTLSVQKLNLLVQKLFCLSDAPKELLLVSSKNSSLRVPLEDEMKDLNFYSVEEGDILLVSA